MSQSPRWREFETEDEMFVTGIDLLSRWSAESISRSGCFKIVLTGGNTVRPFYERARYLETKWSAWHLFWGDERCLPADNPNRNSRLAMEAWLAPVPIPGSQIYPIPAELGPATAASAYANVVNMAGVFDVVLLSLGADGHVASLFPNQEVGDLADTSPVISARAPESSPFQNRVSLASWRLSQTRNMLVFASGPSKQRAVQAWRVGDDLPAARLSALDGIDVLVSGCA